MDSYGYVLLFFIQPCNKIMNLIVIDIYVLFLFSSASVVLIEMINCYKMPQHGLYNNNDNTKEIFKIY